MMMLCSLYPLTKIPPYVLIIFDNVLLVHGLHAEAEHARIVVRFHNEVNVADLPLHQ